MENRSYNHKYFTTNIYLLFRLSLAILALLGCLATRAQAQSPPAILWTNLTLSPVISIDAQTNIYCSSNGGVAMINPAGVILGTNNICPAGGSCQRDASGNFYFAGQFSPPVNFGVTNLTSVSSGNFFIAKYNSSGTCLWAEPFGPPGTIGSGPDFVTFGDLQLDPQGNIYACGSYGYNGNQFYQGNVYKFDPSGSNLWSAGTPRFYSPPSVGQATCKIGGLTSSNGFVYDIATVNNYPNTVFEFTLSGFNTASGAMSQYSHWLYNVSFLVPLPSGLHPVGDGSGGVFSVENAPPQWLLVRRNAAGSIIGSTPVSQPYNPFPIAPDIWGGVYVGNADNTSQLYHFDSAGNLVWQMTPPATPNALVSDAQGNRVLSLTNGTTYRLAPDVFTPPVITNQPTGQTVMAGSNVTFTVTAGGSTPLTYFWQQGTNVIFIGANGTLTLTNVTTNQAGSYSVTVSNLVGTSNSMAAQLRVKEVELFYGNQLLTNGTYFFTNAPVFTLVNEFSNGSSFYTLDGSTPSFLSTPYSGPFSVSSNTTIRAIGYSADFSQSDFADTVIAVPPVQYTLLASTPGGGTVALNPPGGLYLSGSNVTVTATPAAGFSFLYWTNDASGSNPALTVTMNTNKSVVAVFGTTLSNTVSGNGQVFVYPAGPLYPYGSVVRLSALPQSGYCFGVWGNAASGSADPLFFTISNANPVISAAFAPTPGGDAALTVLISGAGRVNASPAGNYFPLNQSVSLTATPDAGKTFLGWSGDASGTNNPLSVSLNQSKVITANFTGTATLFLNPPAGDGFSAQGFKLSLSSDQQAVFQIQSSSNLTTWQNVGTATNVTGVVQFTDPSATNSKTRFYKIAPGP